MSESNNNPVYITARQDRVTLTRHSSFLSRIELSPSELELAVQTFLEAGGELEFSLIDKLKSLEEENAALKNKLKEAELKNTALENQAESLEDTVAMLKSEMEYLEKQFNDVNSKYFNLQLDAQKTEVNLEKKLEKLASDADYLRDVIREQNTQIKDLKDSLEDTNHDNRSWYRTWKQQQEELSALQRKVETRRNAVKLLAAKLRKEREKTKRRDLAPLCVHDEINFDYKQLDSDDWATLIAGMMKPLGHLSVPIPSILSSAFEKGRKAAEVRPQSESIEEWLKYATRKPTS